MAETLSETVRDHLKELLSYDSGVTAKYISESSGVPYSTLNRFLKGEGVNSETLDKLWNSMFEDYGQVDE